MGSTRLWSRFPGLCVSPNTCGLLLDRLRTVWKNWPRAACPCARRLAAFHVAYHVLHGLPRFTWCARRSGRGRDAVPGVRVLTLGGRGRHALPRPQARCAQRVVATPVRKNSSAFHQPSWLGMPGGSDCKSGEIKRRVFSAFPNVFLDFPNRGWRNRSNGDSGLSFFLSRRERGHQRPRRAPDGRAAIRTTGLASFAMKHQLGRNSCNTPFPWRGILASSFP